MATLPAATSQIPLRPSATRSDIDFVEKALVFVGLMILMGTFRDLLAAGQEDRGAGNMKFQLVSGAVYLSAILILLYRGIPGWLFAVLVAALPLVVLTLLPLLSTLWSEAPRITLRRAIALMLTSSFAAYIVARFDLRSLFNLLMGALVVFVIVGIIAAFVPIGGGQGYAAAWQGLTGHKNAFGRTLALVVALLPAAAAMGLVRWRKSALFLSLVALAMLLLSRSATSLVTAFGSIGIGAILYFALGGRVGRFKLRPGLGIAFLLIAVVAVALILIFGWTAILETLGRNPTLTGRTKLWNWALELQDREWLGSGYRAFWIDQNTKYFFVFFTHWHMGPDGVRSESFSGPTHAHSSYVDLTLEFGFVGIAVYTIAILWGLVTLRRTLARGNFEVGFVFAVVLAFVSIYATAENCILQQSDDVWFLFTVLYLLSARESLRSGMESAVGRSDRANPYLIVHKGGVPDGPAKARAVS